MIKWIHAEKYAPSTTYDNFYDKHGNASKPKIVQNHNKPTGYADIGTGWWTIIQHNSESGSGQRNCFFSSQTWLFWTAASLWLHVGQKWYTRDLWISLTWNLIKIAGNLPHAKKHWQAPCFTETSYMVLTKLQQLLAMYTLQTILPCLFCMRNKGSVVQSKCKKCDVGVLKKKCLCNILMDDGSSSWLQPFM